MALKPLTTAQKNVLSKLAEGMVVARLSEDIEGMEKFHEFYVKRDPRIAQAERFFKKALQKAMLNAKNSLIEN